MLLAAAVSSAVASIANAGNTWTGGGGSNVWSDAGNWGGALPGYGTLTFSGSTRLTNSDDYFTSANQLLWTGASLWTLNQGGSTTLSLYDNGGTQAKVENQSTGLVTVNLPITFAATNGANYGEINAVKGGLTFGSGTLTVSGSVVNGIRMFGGGQTTTFANTVSAAGKYFAMTSTGNVVNVSGAFTASDFYVMNGGALNLTAATNPFTADVRLGGDFGTTGTQSLAAGGTFNLTAPAGGITFSKVINSVPGNTSAALAVNSQNTSGTNTLTGDIFLDSNLTIAQSTGGTLAISGNNVDLKGNTLTVNAASSANVNVSGSILNSINSGKLVKSGAGTLTLTGTNTFGGGTTVSAGTLAVGDGGTLGGGVSVAGGATLGFVNSGTLTTASAIVGGNNGTLNAGGSGTLNLTGGTVSTPNSIGSYVQTAGTTNLSGALNIGTATSTNKISVTGNGVLNSSGTSADTVTIVTIGDATPGTLNVTGGSLSVSTASVAGGGGFYVGGRAANATGTLVVSGGTLTVPGPIYIGAGTTGANGAANGTLTVNTSGTFSTDTATSGTFAVGNTAAASGTINLDTGGSIATAQTITSVGTGGNSTFNFNGGTLKANGSVTLLRGLTYANVRAGGAVIDLQASNVIIDQPLLHGDAVIDGGLTVNGIGTLTLTMADTFNGTTTIGGNAILNVNQADALKYSTLTYLAGQGGLHVAATTLSLGALAGDHGITVATASSGPLALAVGYGNTTTDYSGVLSNSGSLEKVGSGMLTLSGANTYAGTTTVTQGVLRINGSTASTKTVTVKNGATLAGTGSIKGPIIVSGTISAGSGAGAADTPGTLSTVGQTWNAGGTDVIKFLGSKHADGTAAVAGSDFDLINLTGLLNLGGLSANSFSLVLTKAAANTFATPAVGTRFKFAYASGKISPDASPGDAYANNYDISGLFALNTDAIGLAKGGFTVVVGNDGNGQDLLLQYNGDSPATPEPGTVALTVAAMAPLLGRRGRRKRDRLP